MVVKTCYVMQYHIFRALCWELLIYTRTKIYSVTWVILHETDTMFQPLKRQCLRELRRSARDWFLYHWQDHDRIMVSTSFCDHTLTVIDAPWSMFRTCTLSSTYVIIHDDVIKGNIFRVTGLFCGEFTDHQWIPLAKASYAPGGALMFSLICAWINSWVNNRDSSDLRHHRAHYDIIVMYQRNNMWNIGNKIYQFYLGCPITCSSFLIIDGWKSLLVY